MKNKSLSVELLTKDWFDTLSKVNLHKNSNDVIEWCYHPKLTFKVRCSIMNLLDLHNFFPEIKLINFDEPNSAFFETIKDCQSKVTKSLSNISFDKEIVQTCYKLFPLSKIVNCLVTTDITEIGNIEIVLYSEYKPLDISTYFILSQIMLHFNKYGFSRQIFLKHYHHLYCFSEDMNFIKDLYIPDENDYKLFIETSPNYIIADKYCSLIFGNVNDKIAIKVKEFFKEYYDYKIFGIGKELKRIEFIKSLEV